MKCPYCGKEMENGYIPASKFALMWIPEGERVPTTIFNKTKTGVNLTKVPFWTMQKAESFIVILVKWLLLLSKKKSKIPICNSNHSYMIITQ
jgi:hypothetical protein